MSEQSELAVVMVSASVLEELCEAGVIDKARVCKRVRNAASEASLRGQNRAASLIYAFALAASCSGKPAEPDDPTRMSAVMRLLREGRRTDDEPPID